MCKACKACLEETRWRAAVVVQLCHCEINRTVSSILRTSTHTSVSWPHGNEDVQTRCCALLMAFCLSIFLPSELISPPHQEPQVHVTLVVAFDSSKLETDQPGPLSRHALHP